MMTADPPADPSAYFSENDIPLSSAQGEEITKEQQEILDKLAVQFPEKLPGLANEAHDDKAFLAAAEKASYTNPVFAPHGLDITMLLPDPRAESLDKMGIGSYTPYSGARDYIRNNYAKLINMETSDRIEIPVTFYYEGDIGGVQTLDWSLGSIIWGLNDYMNVFFPHVEQYLNDMGFHSAAIELLMPDIRNIGDTPGQTECLDEFFSDIADALSFKGVDIGGQLIVDSKTIEKALRERLVQTWVSDNVSVMALDNNRPYMLRYLKMRSLTAITFFSSVREELDAQYKSGSQTKPSSQDDLEKAFIAAANKKAGEILESSAAKDQELISEQEYPFSWDALGEQGVSACPDIIEDIRRHLDSYDFSLMFIR